jgi:cytochrome c-type biogenesis protein CcmH
MGSYFWFAAGTLSGVAAAFVLIPLSRKLGLDAQPRARRYAASLMVVIAISAGALVLYRTLGRPDLLEPGTPVAVAPHAGAEMGGSQNPPDSLENAAARLEERIAKQGGSRDDWLLLAQSYEFMGREPEAARAREQAASAPESVADSVVAEPEASRSASGGVDSRIAELERAVKAAPRDADAWLGLASAYRRARDFTQAREAYRRVESLGAMNADSWADLADTLGSLSNGVLDDEAARAIERALALDAGHAKALWLKASRAHQQHRYSEALALWRTLRAQLPSESPDARIIDLNIEEAERLAGSSGTPTLARASAPIQVSGTVSLDAKFTDRVAPGVALFIYAKAADSPGPPLAVLRTSTGKWPLSFRLDDTLSMMPARKLSSFDKVIVEARISRTGQATPTAGDLYAVSPVIRPADGGRINLVISREVI